MRHVPIAALSVLALSLGCASYRPFVPPNDHRAYLVLTESDLALCRDSRLVGFATEPDALTGWDSLAHANAMEAARLYRSGFTQQSIGFILLPFVMPIGLIVGTEGEAKMHRARALLIDAMNIQNDRVDSGNGSIEGEHH